MQKNNSTKMRRDGFSSIFDDLPGDVCPLERSFEMGNRCAKVGFDWNSPDGAKNKIMEELEELEKAASDRDEDEIFWEVGDVLLAAANLARLHGKNPSRALAAALERFSRRFGAVEMRLKNEGRKLTEATLEELEEHWQEVKKREH